MDVDAKTLTGKSTIRRKLLGYWHAWKQELHTTQWDFKSFRILIVTPSAARLSNMLGVQHAITNGGSNLFLFSTPKRIADAGPLGEAWVSGKGALVAVTDVYNWKLLRRDLALERREAEATLTGIVAAVLQQPTAAAG